MGAIRLRTEIPGPKARAHVKFDEEWTSPSLPRAYPIVPVRGAGMAIEDIDGNLFLDFAAGIAVNSTGHAHPRVVGAIKEQASELIHYSASDFYVPVYAETNTASSNWESDYQAACATFTQDNRVDAVLGSSFAYFVSFEAALDQLRDRPRRRLEAAE